MNFEELEKVSAKIVRAWSSGETSLDLSFLEMTSEDLEVLMPEILMIPNLAELNMFMNYGIKKLPDSLCELSSLTKLIIGNTDITDLPEDLYMLSNLTELRAFGTKIRELPGCIDRLANLEILDLTGSRLERLPNSLSGLLNLTRLEVANNRITEVPETLLNLPRIQNLEFQSNPLSMEAISLLNHIGQREGVTVRTNLAALDRIQSYEDVLTVFYPDYQERTLMMGRLEACYLDPATIIYGGDHQEVTSAQDVMKKFLGKVLVDSEFERNSYGATAKMLFEKILDLYASGEKAKIEEGNTIVLEMAISMGDCGTPVKAYLEQKYVGEIRKEGNKLSDHDEFTIERLALMEKAGTLPGLKSSDRNEEVNALVNLVFSKEKVDQAHMAMNRVPPNVVFVGGVERDLLPISSYPVICFSLIKDNHELMEQFATLICETKDNKLVQTADGEYIVDEEKIKKLKENYLGTGDELVRNQHASKYEEEMKEFIKTENMNDLVYSEHLTEANERDLGNLPKQQKELKRLLGEKTGKENIEQEYKRYVSEMKMSLIDFRKEMAQKKTMSKFATPTITRKRPRSESPDRDRNHTEGQGESKVRHVSQRRL
ncbi:leucine-rich repeat domain-containing protein [Flavobacterium sp. LAR06]|uniref:leucine-rich repeat domain-containing protein n=1 Tax=Flavobacterium sp. LAR06 TaxID=3064897 RepID=UPI0035C15EFC